MKENKQPVLQYIATALILNNHRLVPQCDKKKQKSHITYLVTFEEHNCNV